MNTPLKAKTETEARNEATQLSKSNPGKYVTVYACFGLFASLQNRLHRFSPSDSVFSWYVLNGQIKPFTNKQQITDQNSTPSLY
mgnify:CR=1 FL=1